MRKCLPYITNQRVKLIWNNSLQDNDWQSLVKSAELRYMYMYSHYDEWFFCCGHTCLSSVYSLTGYQTYHSRTELEICSSSGRCGHSPGTFFIIVNSLQPIWKSGTCLFHLRFPDLQTSSLGLIKWEHTLSAIPEMDINAACLIDFHELPNGDVPSRVR